MSYLLIKFVNGTPWILDSCPDSETDRKHKFCSLVKSWNLDHGRKIFSVIQTVQLPGESTLRNKLIV